MLNRVMRVVVVAAIAGFVVGCQSVSGDYTPDPKLKTASMGQLRAKVVNACVMTQRAKRSMATGELQSKCGCYAARTFKAMQKDDVAFYRDNGYFSDASRPAAMAALNACGLD